MSLNGLDAAKVNEAYDSALQETGGWLLLSYISRDEVDIYRTGNGGPSDIKEAISQYEEKSPLYGLLVYRRKKVLVKYVPDGTSRLLQARLAVHMQSVLERFPHDALLPIASAAELTDSALSSSVSALKTSNSIKSMNSLKRRRLTEIVEDASEIPIPNTSPSTPTDATRSELADSFSTDDYSIHDRHQDDNASTSTTKAVNDSEPNTAGTIAPISTSLAPVAAHEAESSPSISNFSQEPDSRPSLALSESAQSISSKSINSGYSPSSEAYSHLYKPKLKLAPRPVTESRHSSPYERPTSSLPTGIQLQTRDRPKMVSPTTTQRSPRSPDFPTQPWSPQSNGFSSASVYNAPVYESRPVSRGSVATVPANVRYNDENTMTPEKKRLMKALQKRKQQQKARQLAKEGHFEEEDDTRDRGRTANESKRTSSSTSARSHSSRKTAKSPLSNQTSPVEPTINKEDRKDSYDSTAISTTSNPLVNDAHLTPPAVKNDSNPVEHDQTSANTGTEIQTEHLVPPNASFINLPATHGNLQSLPSLLQFPNWSDANEQSSLPLSTSSTARNIKEEPRQDQGNDGTHIILDPTGPETAEISGSNQVSNTEPNIEHIGKEHNDIPDTVLPEQEVPRQDQEVAQDLKSSSSSLEPSNETEQMPASHEIKQAHLISETFPKSEHDVLAIEKPLDQVPAVDTHEERFESIETAEEADKAPEAELNEVSTMNSATLATKSDPVRHDGTASDHEQSRASTPLPIQSPLSEKDEYLTNEQIHDAHANTQGNHTQRTLEDTEDETDLPEISHTPKRGSKPIPINSIRNSVSPSKAASLSEEDSLFDELQGATVEEATSVRLAKTPPTSFPPLLSRQLEARQGSETSRQVSQPSEIYKAVPSSLPSDAVASSPGPNSPADYGNQLDRTTTPEQIVPLSRPATRDISSSSYANSIVNARSRSRQGSLSPTGPDFERPSSRKSTVSSLISQRIKAYEDKFNATSSPQQTPISAVKAQIVTLRKVSLNTPPTSANTTMQPRSGRSTPSPYPTPSPSPHGSVQRFGFGKNPRKEAPSFDNDSPDDAAKTTISKLNQGVTEGLPRIAVSPEVPPIPSEPKAKKSFFSSSKSRKSKTNSMSSTTSQKKEGRLSVDAAQRENSTGTNSSDSIGRSRSPSSVESLASEAEKKDPKKKAGLLKRLSGLGSNTRRTIAETMSEPVAKQVVEKPREPVNESKWRSSVMLGDLNIQFPDTLLWKRRNVEIDSQGFLLLAAPQSDKTSKVALKRYHISEFRKPYVPEPDREELPYSVNLDFLDGSTIQCACDGSLGQQRTFQAINAARDAYIAS